MNVCNHRNLFFDRVAIRFISWLADSSKTVLTDKDGFPLLRLGIVTGRNRILRSIVSERELVSIPRRIVLEALKVTAWLDGFTADGSQTRPCERNHNTQNNVEESLDRDSAR